MWIFYVFSVLCLLCLCTRLFICALWSPAGKGLTSGVLLLVFYFTNGILGQVWYLIVSIPDLCTLTYFVVISGLLMEYRMICTVNSEIFARVLFSRNFAFAKFREIQILAKRRNHFVIY